jgi:hypothetical protein
MSEGTPSALVDERADPRRYRRAAVVGHRERDRRERIAVAGDQAEARVVVTGAYFDGGTGGVLSRADGRAGASARGEQSRERTAREAPEESARAHRWGTE